MTRNNGQQLQRHFEAWLIRTSRRPKPRGAGNTGEAHKPATGSGGTRPVTAGAGAVRTQLVPAKTTIALAFDGSAQTSKLLASGQPVGHYRSRRKRRQHDRTCVRRRAFVPACVSSSMPPVIRTRSCACSTTMLTPLAPCVLSPISPPSVANTMPIPRTVDRPQRSTELLAVRNSDPDPMSEVIGDDENARAVIAEPGAEDE